MTPPAPTSPRSLRRALLVAAALAAGCTGRQIREDTLVRRAELSAPLPPPAPLALDAPGPWQLALRLGPEVVEKLVWAALAPRLAAATEVQDGLIPYLRPERVAVNLSGCPLCIGVTLEVEAGVRARASDGILGMFVSEAAEALRTRAEIRMEGRLRLVRGSEGPNLEIAGLRVASLRMSGGVQADVSLPRQLIESGVSQVIDEALSDGAEPPRLPLPDAVEMGGLPLAITGLAVSTPRETGSQGELLVGITTQLPAAGQVDGPGGIPLASGEWAVVVGASVIEEVLRRTTGAPPPDPKADLRDVRRVDVDSDGVAVAVRLWHPRWRPWWQDYGITWVPGISDGLPAPKGVILSEGQSLGASRRAPHGPEASVVTAGLLADAGALLTRTTRWAQAMESTGTPVVQRVVTAPDRVAVVGRLSVPRPR